MLQQEKHKHFRRDPKHKRSHAAAVNGGSLGACRGSGQCVCVGGGGVVPLQEGDCPEVVRPVEGHRLCAVAECDRPRAKLVTLQRNVLGRIGGPDDQDILIRKLRGLAEVVGVQDPPRELAEPRELWEGRSGEVSGGDDNVVKLLGRLGVRGPVVCCNRELSRGLVVGHVADDGVEADLIQDTKLGCAAHDVVVKHLQTHTAPSAYICKHGWNGHQTRLPTSRNASCCSTSRGG